MSSAVLELEAGLQAMLSLKPPGVSGSRIQGITALCTANVQSESVLIQKLYTHFKKAPGTHKLGVLYVVDSVTRKWTEQAKSAGQPITVSAPDGTFAAGVNRVKELLPVLMNDIIQSAPDDQKEKIRKLVDIWEKGQTFPLQLLTQFKERLNAPAQNQSTTPPGSPPADVQQIFNIPASNAQPTNPVPTPGPAPASVGPSSILAALANMARQNTTAPAPAPTNAPQPMDNSYNVSSAHSSTAQQFTAMTQSAPYVQVPPPVNVPAAAATFASQPQGPNSIAQNIANNQNNPYAAALPVVPPGAFDPAVQQQLLLIKALADQGLAPDKIASIVGALNQGQPLAGAVGLNPQVQPPQFALQNQDQNGQNAQNAWGPRPDDSRDHNGYHDREPVRSPPNRYRQRSRSRSPPRGWNGRDSPNARRRDEQGFDFERNSPGRNRGDDRGRGRGNDYRQRSPQRRGHSPTPPRSEKWIGHDTSISKGNIKVLSRTLFVGGVTMSEQELRKIFDNFGQVQTCIVNKEKRHAFVKMISRADAVNAKDAMEKNRTPDSQLRTRWGVGFGPRDCSDYQTGVSIIPISKLTDADRKWMLTAEYGGSGGKPIVSGMVVEEPDIEIGQGVSSKAISRRMQTDKGGNTGPKSSRERDEDEAPRHRRGGDRDDRRHEDRRDGGRKDRNNVSAPPKMPPIPQFSMAGFPNFNMPNLPNGMPMIPPGFNFPGQNQSPR
ncbi:hypothetical protein G7Y89_g3749 [Cudoniella acicularis]|uniref:Uncharacterized protein n=1 Tax=Cudoniella acicularis TaxID=354080 RepID=A0A8H4W5B2_9HELO|nr:hypothetical protein G7Y89_g3749 [Cudoniella acicularis]